MTAGTLETAAHFFHHEVDLVACVVVVDLSVHDDEEDSSKSEENAKRTRGREHFRVLVKWRSSMPIAWRGERRFGVLQIRICVV